MSDEDRDRWAELQTPEAVAAAARRMKQLGTSPSELAARRQYLDLLAPRAGERVLDVGAGTGEIAVELIRRVQPGGTVTALDPCEGLLDIAIDAARQAGLDAKLQAHVGDARDLPYGDNEFDVAFCHWVLLHVASPEQVLQEMVRVLRPDGRLLCVEVDWETMTIYPGDRDLVRRIVQTNVDRQLDGQMGRQLAPLFRKMGLQKIHVEPIVDVDFGGDQQGWLAFLESRIPIVVDAGMASRAEAEQWWTQVQQAVADGTYFFSVTQFAVLGRPAGH